MSLDPRGGLAPRKRGRGRADGSGRGAVAYAHQADGIELGLLTRALLGAFAHLVALVEQFDLLELFESLAERGLGVVELHFELVGRTLQVLAPLDRSLGIG